MKFLYHIGIHVYGFLIFTASLFNAKAKKRLLGQQQVFSLLEEKINQDSNSQYVWFHAASLGEFEQGRPVIELLKKNQPEIKILLTFFSPSGYEVRKNYPGADIVCYLPLDTRSNAKRFIELVKPEKVLFIKYEFWPNFLTYCKKKNIPTYVISASFRPSQLFFKWYGSPYAGLLNLFDKLYVQDENSRTLLRSINIQNVEVVGDTRFDRVLEIAAAKKELPLVDTFKNGQQLIIAGSSWPKDEELLFQYLQNHKDVKLVVAPHEIHEGHLASIESNCKLSVVRYSRATAEELISARCLMIDNFGLLSSVYQYADIAYIGGGFGVGIHNVLEAAVYAIPVVFGPNYERFREARELIALGGSLSIMDYTELESAFDWLFLHKEAGVKAGSYVEHNQGATQRIVDGIFN